MSLQLSSRPICVIFSSRSECISFSGRSVRNLISSRPACILFPNRSLRILFLSHSVCTLSSHRSVRALLSSRLGCTLFSHRSVYILSSSRSMRTLLSHRSNSNWFCIYLIELPCATYSQVALHTPHAHSALRISYFYVAPCTPYSQGTSGASPPKSLTGVFRFSNPFTRIQLSCHSIPTFITRAFILTMLCVYSVLKSARAHLNIKLLGFNFSS